jgi:hypothetical protein
MMTLVPTDDDQNRSRELMAASVFQQSDVAWMKE